MSAAKNIFTKEDKKQIVKAIELAEKAIILPEK